VGVSVCVVRVCVKLHSYVECLQLVDIQFPKRFSVVVGRHGGHLFVSFAMHQQMGLHLHAEKKP
jgi:hypothetical protein